MQIDDNTPSSVPNNGVQFSVITNDYVLVQKDKITSVSIPSSVKEIGAAAFAYCKNLKEVEFASGLEKIEHDAFYYTGITNLLLPNSVKYIGAAAFCSCSDLAKVSLSKNLEFLGMHNFVHSKLDNSISDNYFIVDGWFITYISSNGSYPKVLSIPQNTIGIAEQSSIYLYDNAMHDTSKIELPSSITIISNNAFIYYLGLEQFDVSADNPYFCDVNGVLYNKDLTSLIRFPANSTVTDFSFPSTIISTSPLAFYSCEKLKSVKMDNKLSDLGGAAFMGCKNLKSVTFSNNLKRLNASTRIYSAGMKGSIDIRGTFEQCDSLTEIVIPANINYIGNQSFAFCQGLKKVVVENPECEIDDASGEWTFYNGLDDKNNAIDIITLYGYKNSTLQFYAQKYNMRFIEINTTISFGDVNGDNQINAVDASAVLAYYALISTNKDGNFNESQKAAADVNDDGQINAVDASNILAYYAYLSTTKEDILSLKEYMKKK
ncbi:leucine-rich repeat protein [Ruminococcus sp.]